jgi:hypothetical protein
MEQEIIKGWVLVDLDNPLQHIANALICQPHAERFIQPHPFISDEQNSQPPAKQRDEDDYQPGRQLVNFDFFVHRL